MAESGVASIVSIGLLFKWYCGGSDCDDVVSVVWCDIDYCGTSMGSGGCDCAVVRSLGGDSHEDDMSCDGIDLCFITTCIWGLKI